MGREGCLAAQGVEFLGGGKLPGGERSPQPPVPPLEFHRDEAPPCSVRRCGAASAVSATGTYALATYRRPPRSTYPSRQLQGAVPPRPNMAVVLSLTLAAYGPPLRGRPCGPAHGAAPRGLPAGTGPALRHSEHPVQISHKMILDKYPFPLLSRFSRRLERSRLMENTFRIVADGTAYVLYANCGDDLFHAATTSPLRLETTGRGHLEHVVCGLLCRVACTRVAPTKNALGRSGRGGGGGEGGVATSFPFFPLPSLTPSARGLCTDYR